jgi:hypothetical protein
MMCLIMIFYANVWDHIPPPSLPLSLLRFQDWVVYESSLNSRARIRAEL